MTNWPPVEPPPGLAPNVVRIGRPDLLAHYQKVLALRLGRPVRAREAADIALLMARRCETLGGPVADQRVAEAVVKPIGRPPKRTGAAAAPMTPAILFDKNQTVCVCPHVCEATAHWHGADKNGEASFGHRGAHCHIFRAPQASNGYVLRPATDAEAVAVGWLAQQRLTYPNQKLSARWRRLEDKAPDHVLAVLRNVLGAMPSEIAERREQADLRPDA